ncbi:hypothetical protein LTR62_000248 [Meristemomyces frigidus]|uniref:AB hydrolase-1 domain-containing protein n=1 Tax=Meristemomyces frigidus TaxID=1508187 RepID=A0AAN7YNS8_9PEZI|nr:hypothetical protein LTR62_000248 [Meristemomyces frigidus]
MADKSLLTIEPSLKQHDTKVSSGGTVRAFSHDTGSGPVLCLFHGWPQSSYMWRHCLTQLKEKYTLYIPELPGYGLSSLPSKHDKRTVGNLIIEGLQSVFGKERKVVWCGHDRGGRIGHRLIVDANPAHNITSAMLWDIVPTTEQWRSFSNPVAAAAYYHWSFLATETAPQMIEAMGGFTWTKMNLERVKGKNAEGIKRFREGNAIDHYSHNFTNPEAVAGSCGDYYAGAFEDVDEQKKDQEAGRKVGIPIFVGYSASNLGRMHDVDSVWPQWTDGKAELKCVGIPDGFGHFLPEECPEQVVKLIDEWMVKYGK